jgi:hypothetical protein
MTETVIAADALELPMPPPDMMFRVMGAGESEVILSTERANIENYRSALSASNADFSAFDS